MYLAQRISSELPSVGARLSLQLECSQITLSGRVKCSVLHVIYDPAGLGDFTEEILTQSLVVDDQSKVLGVQDPAESAQGRVQVQLLEGVVRGSLHWVSAVYFSLENREWRLKLQISSERIENISNLEKYLFSYLHQFGLQTAHCSHADNLAALRDDG